MGRHAAPAAFDAPAPAEALSTAERLPWSGSDVWSPDNPVTDPRLFDAPLPAAQHVPTPQLRQAPPAPAPAEPRVSAERSAARPAPAPPAEPVWTASARTAPAAGTRPAAPTGLREIRTTATPTPSSPAEAALPPAAERYPGLARTPQPSTAAPVASLSTAAPAPTLTASTATLTATPTGVLPSPRPVAAAHLATPAKDVPAALRRSRAVPLSISAVAVLGALSAAAVVLPAGHAPAEAADRSTGTDTNSIPVPTSATKAAAAKVAKAKKAHTNNGRHLGQLKRAATGAAPLLRPTTTPASGTGTPTPTLTPTGAPVLPATPTTGTTASTSSSTTTASASASASATPAARPTATHTATTTPTHTTRPTPTHTTTTTPTPSRTTTPPSTPTSGTALRSIVAAAGNGSLLSLQAARYVVNDFDSNLMAVNLQNRGITGAGVDRTVIEMGAHTSTKAGRVPTAAYTTNQLYLLSTIGGTPGLSGFTLRATPQNHLYNGLRIGKAVGARVHDVKIEAVPGKASFPPGETFVLNDWRTDGSVYSRVTIDGAGVAAAGFGTNSSKNVTINDSTFTGTAYSSGAAIWQTTNITMNDVRIVNNRSGINFERSGGTIKLVRPVFKGNAHYDMQFGTDLGGGIVTIVDPVLAPGQKLRLNVPANYHGHVNGQKRSNIHVIVNGVDRTKELVQYR